MRAKELAFLLLLTVGALLVHGYHPWAEDAEIYLPGVERTLNPRLFPKGAEFFEPYTRLSLFHHLIAGSVRVSHLPLAWALFAWQLASIFLLLLACWRLSRKCFADRPAQWASVALVAALLTLPVAGTALYIFDQYVNPRNLAAFASIFAIVEVLERKYVQAGVCLTFATAMHPLMAIFALSYAFLLVVMEKFNLGLAFLDAWFPVQFSFQRPSEAYQAAAQYHAFHYIQSWHWYEWQGIVGPVPIFWWFARMARRQQSLKLDLMCRALIVYDLVYFAAALIVSLPARFGSLARIQPLRSLHLLYILLLVFSGGFLGQHILKKHFWRWAVLFLPLCSGMFFVQRSLFANSAHVEWPGTAPKNPWAQAFIWIRENTPADAMFALDPKHMLVAGEDAQGFRTIAQRSMLADALKDSGAVSMFPPLAEEWYRQVSAASDWRHFQAADLRGLGAKYGVGWVVLQQPGVPGLDCPYQNSAVLVCRVD